MPRINFSFIGQREQFLTDVSDKHLFAAASQVRTSYTEAEQSIACEQDIFFLAIETQRPQGMSRHMKNRKRMVPELDDITFIQISAERDGCVTFPNPKRTDTLCHLIKPRQISLVSLSLDAKL